MLAGIAVALDDPEPRPPAPTAPSVHLIGGRSTSLPAWPVRIPTLSPCDIAASRTLARAVGLRAVLHQGWLPQRPAPSAVPPPLSGTASASTTAAAGQCQRLRAPLRGLPSTAGMVRRMFHLPAHGRRADVAVP